MVKHQLPEKRANTTTKGGKGNHHQLQEGKGSHQHKKEDSVTMVLFIFAVLGVGVTSCSLFHSGCGAAPFFRFVPS